MAACIPAAARMPVVDSLSSFEGLSMDDPDTDAKPGSRDEADMHSSQHGFVRQVLSHAADQVRQLHLAQCTQEGKGCLIIRSG